MPWGYAAWVRPSPPIWRGLSAIWGPWRPPRGAISRRGRGTGPEPPEAVTGWFARRRNQKLLEKLKTAGVWPRAIHSASVRRPLNGKTFVITGTLPNLSRPDAKTLIEKHGGKGAGSPSPRTDHLLLGAGP